MARVPRRRFLSGKPTNLMRFVSQVFLDIAIDIQSWMFDNDRDATSTAINSMEIDVYKTYIQLSAVDYMPFALQGRGPGGFPPPQTIIDWIIAKPIQVTDISIESLAFLIGRKIAREGTDPPHLQQDDLDIIYNQSYKKFEDRISKALERETLQKLDKIFAKNEEITIQ